MCLIVQQKIKGREEEREGGRGGRKDHSKVKQQREFNIKFWGDIDIQFIVKT